MVLEDSCHKQQVNKLEDRIEMSLSTVVNRETVDMDLHLESNWNKTCDSLQNAKLWS